MPGWQSYKNITIPQDTPTGDAGGYLKTDLMYLADQALNAVQNPMTSDLDGGNHSITDVNQIAVASATITISAAGNKGLTIESHSGQTANLLELQNSSGTARAYIGPTGSDAMALTLFNSSSDYGTVSIEVRTPGDGGVGISPYCVYINGSIDATLQCQWVRSNNATITFGVGRLIDNAALGTDTYSPTAAGGTSSVDFVSVFSPSAGSNAASFAAVEINPQINGTSAGTATGLAIASKTNMLAGGTINLIDAGTTSTDYFTGYTSKFRVDQNGYITVGGGLRLLGRTSSTGDPTTTQLPNDMDCAVHKNTTNSNIYLAYNDGGTIKKVQLS